MSSRWHILWFDKEDFVFSNYRLLSLLLFIFSSFKFLVSGNFRFGHIYHNLQPRVTKTFLHSFLDPTKALPQHYGAIKGIEALGSRVVCSDLDLNLLWLLNCFILFVWWSLTDNNWMKTLYFSFLYQIWLFSYTNMITFTICLVVVDNNEELSLFF